MNAFLLIIFLVPLFLELSLCDVKWPTPSQTIEITDTKKVRKHLDCNYKKYVPVGGGWGSGEYMKPVIEIADGVKISRCIVEGGDGFHCLGTCTIEDCWNDDVKDDSISLFGTKPNSLYKIIGGGARHGKGKTIQFDGAGKLNVTNFYIDGAGQGIRPCGNCAQQYRNREVHVDGLTIRNLEAGQYVVGVNKNYNERAYLKNIHILGSTANQVFPCKVFQGNNQGKNPKVLQMEGDKGGDGTYCIYKASDIHINS
uniref:Probable pectate lyase F n=1 Tax=Meloidogyne javanica TaxID=6303 RepID=A0A915MEK9_MELJA